MTTSTAKKAPTKRAPAKKTAPPAKKAAQPALTPVVDEGDDLTDVPVELQFTSDSGNRRDPEVIDIAIDGRKFTLTQPSTAFLTLVATGVFSENTSQADKVLTMFNIIRTCMDPIGAAYVNERIRATDNSFDDELLGSIVGTVLKKWAPEIENDLQPKPANRAERRQAARS